MTVSTIVQRVDSPGNGVATTFSFSPVVILNAAELVVTLRTSAGVETVLSQGTLNNNYSVNATTYPGTGSITYPAAGSTGGTTLPTGSTLVIERIMPLLQSSVFRNQTAFYGTAVEAALDYLMMVDQQQQEQLGRTIQAAATDPALPLTLPTSVQRANQLLGFDSSGNPIAAQPSSALVSSAMQAIVNAASTALAISLLGLRRPCTANTTFYVDGTNGTDDVAHGLTSTTGAFKTIQFAINTIQSYYDGRGFAGTISVAGTAGTVYGVGAGLVVSGPFINFSTMTLSCNAALNSVRLLSSGSYVLLVQYGAELYVNGGFKFETALSGANNIGALYGGRIFLSGITVGPILLGVCLAYATRFGYIEFLTDCHVANGTSANLMQASHHGNIRLSNGAVIQFDSNHVFTDATLYVDYGDITITAGGSFNLNGHVVQGQRYRAAENGLLQWADGGAGANSVPGDVLGAEVNGGRYFYGVVASEITASSTSYNMATASGAVMNFGIGFKPGEVDFIASVTGGAAGMMGSVGWATMVYNGASTQSVGTQACIFGGFDGAQPNAGSACIGYTTSPGNSVSATFTGLTSDGNGFSLTWTKVGSPTGTLVISWKARRAL